MPPPQGGRAAINGNKRKKCDTKVNEKFSIANVVFTVVAVRRWRKRNVTKELKTKRQPKRENEEETFRFVETSDIPARFSAEIRNFLFQLAFLAVMESRGNSGADCDDDTAQRSCSAQSSFRVSTSERLTQREKAQSHPLNLEALEEINELFPLALPFLARHIPHAQGNIFELWSLATGKQTTFHLPRVPRRESFLRTACR